MKALWKGGISFGLVNIPVKLYSGAQTHRIDLDMIRKKDQCRIEYVRVCKKDGKEVPWDEIAKGYKKENGDYVILEKEDIARAMPEKTQTIDIFEFVKEDEIPSKYLEKPYLVEPDKIAAKTYALLRDALKKSGKVGLCKFVIRTSEHLGILTPQDDAIVLIQIRFEQDLRDPKELKLPTKSVTISKKELDMALNIIDQLTDKFEPEKYKDTYKDELLKLIKKKAAAKGKKVVAEDEPKKKKERHPADDLLDQLRASLEAIKN
ncbi:non-homologous end joining protein Ku [Flavobacterium selenitireducens]|uniref:non-homologous end joining protein Ku n=1 Tax=Flavobacterium selenitireducens TaxID=2722704 RepID=UPI00168B4686|nr:Ku protein [Flavobacterium selenitireducens]MBD3581363.1 Ku protein [Flavobacterium selenitireducens]